MLARIFFIILFLFSLSTTFSQDSLLTKQNKDKTSLFKDSIDGAYDISRFLNTAAGFMPVPILITEPAVGYGGGLAMLFIHKSKKHTGAKVPPSISGALGFGTENKTWGVGAFHFHVFGPDRVRSITGGGYFNVNFNYYGNNNEYLDKNPVKLNLKAWALIQRVQVRIKESRFFVGGSYVFVSIESALDTFPDKPLINEIIGRLKGETDVSMIQPIVNYDSRNTIFTPSKGLSTGASFSYSATWLGSSRDFYLLNPYFIGYFPIAKKLFSGWRFDSNFMFGDPVRYMEPYISLRGVPAARYQSNFTMLVETEWRYQFYKRWSIDAFVGTGKAFPSFNDFKDATLVYNYGGGFRYELAREYGLHAGVDFASSNENNFAFYIVVGSVWNK